MKKYNLIAPVFACLMMLSCKSVSQPKTSDNANTLKSTLGQKFHIGTALNLRQINERDSAAHEVVVNQFNSIVAENCMKSMYMQPKEGDFYFADADKFVAFGEKYNKHMVGHTLIWHSQAPNWFFVDGNGDKVSREVLIQRMKKHITTIVSRYKGRIKGWDVVNEAVLDNGEYRDSEFYKIIGEDFIPLAFKFAHEADPEAELYYNDYSTAIPSKREGIVRLVKNVQAHGARIDAIGMQEHIALESPSLEETEKSILAFSGLGVDVMVTELDISVLPSPRRNMGAEISIDYDYDKAMNPYVEGLPDSVENKFNDRYVSLFELYLKHQDKIDRVTLWGVGDKDSWKNDWPMRGRRDYPLLFDIDYKPKPVVSKLINLVNTTE